MYILRKKVFGVFILLVLILTACSDTSEPVTRSAQDDPYLVLVNKTHQLPPNWEDIMQIDTVQNSFGETIQIEHKTFENFLDLRDALANEGIQIELDSVYRSAEDQQELWDFFLEKYGEDYTRQFVAVPGYSEHQTGLAVDIFIVKNGQVIRENEDMVADKEDFAVIHRYLNDYGFILRYPEGKEATTGYSYEPWHLRYVDSRDVAKEITENNLTLEEYLGET